MVQGLFMGSPAEAGGAAAFHWLQMALQ